MIHADYQPYVLKFKRPAGTSRGVMQQRPVWFLILRDPDQPELTAVGECSPLPGLSIDDRPDYEKQMEWVCEHINDPYLLLNDALTAWPSIRFGLEIARKQILFQGSFQFSNTDFARGVAGIPINGLIWMGEPSFMRDQIHEKLDHGYRCLKLKIGAIDWKVELSLLRSIRREFSNDKLEIRVDANGAFSPDQALSRLKELAELSIHSIEQPIPAGQWDQMASLCEQSPLAIALDEELIGVKAEDKLKCLDTIRPQYLVLKPSLLGGLAQTGQWVQLANEQGIPWWVTSALESNIGLNAIAHWVAGFDPDKVQGLGTGQLYTNNIPSPLSVRKDQLWYHPSRNWDLTELGIY